MKEVPKYCYYCGKTLKPYVGFGSVYMECPKRNQSFIDVLLGREDLSGLHTFELVADNVKIRNYDAQTGEKINGG